MRRPGVDREAHAVLAGHDPVVLLQLQQQGHEVARRLEPVVLERTHGDHERFRDLLQQFGLHSADAALVVPDRALGEANGIGELGLRQPLRLAVPPNVVACRHVPSCRSHRRLLQGRCVVDQGNQGQFDEKDIYFFHQKGGML